VPVCLRAVSEKSPDNMSTIDSGCNLIEVTSQLSENQLAMTFCTVFQYSLHVSRSLGNGRERMRGETDVKRGLEEEQR
jgi:hypothetical protein